MKFLVDKALCSGHGQCAAMAPEVYDIDDDGFNVDVGRSVEVPAEKEAAARAGADVCPESAITLLD